MLSDAIAVLCLSVLLSADVGNVVSHVVRPVMQHYGVPGMAVGIVMSGNTYVFDYGVASRATAQPITGTTLFEIGSVSKTFTATLASYAHVSGKLSLSDMASTYLPSLRGSSFDHVSLQNLGTHTSGGLPLQVPDDITSDDQLMSFLEHWKPAYTPGTYRVYSNVGIGILGMIAAKSMSEDFTALMQTALFPKLGLKNTYIDVPKSKMGDYAQGYTSKDVPVRVSRGVLDSEAYGVKTTAGDLLHFLQANMHMLALDDAVQRAITETHTGYYRIGAMTQDLIWEQYRYPVTLEQLHEGNSAKVLFDANPAIALNPPSQPQNDVFLNKTGSTNGFGTYVAFIPEEKIGIVLLANKNYPIDARVTAAYEILTHLEAH